MCGIVGIVGSSGSVRADVLQRMSDVISHRGPDGEGFLIGSGRTWTDLRYGFHSRADEASHDSQIRVGLGHRRLAVLDLSERGLQPMANGRRPHLDRVQWRNS
jgi:asparagine synthase (glutamine-hydrolysing)